MHGLAMVVEEEVLQSLAMRQYKDGGGSLEPQNPKSNQCIIRYQIEYALQPMAPSVAAKTVSTAQ